MKKRLISTILIGLMGIGGLAALKVQDGRNKAALQEVADYVVLATGSAHRDDLQSKTDQYDPAAIRQTAQAFKDGQFPDYRLVTADFSDDYVIRVEVTGQFTMLPAGIWMRDYVSDARVPLPKYWVCELENSLRAREQCLPMDKCRLVVKAEKSECIPTGTIIAK